MKKFIFLLSILATIPAFADTASTKIGTFKGTLSIETEGLDIKNIQIEISNQFCNFWGTTCAGGPRDTEILPITVEESKDGKIFNIANEAETENSSLKIGNRFSSCNVNLIVEGINAEGKLISGQKKLVWENDKKVCASREAVTNLVRKNLNHTLIVTDGGIYIKIQ